MIAEEAAHLMVAGLKQEFGPYITGPAEPVVGKVRNLYLRELLLKLPKDAQLVSRCKQRLLQQIAIIHTNKRYRSVEMVCDADPL